MEEKTILCPHCNEELNVEEQQLDSEMECPHCWKKINGSTPQDLESDTSLNEDEPDPGCADEEIKISPKEFWLKTPLISLLIFGAFVIVAKILNEIEQLKKKEEEEKMNSQVVDNPVIEEKEEVRQ